MKFCKSLSKELDKVVSRIGVVKIILIIITFLLARIIIVTYFDDFIYTFYLLVLLTVALSIISLEDNSKIKYIAVWGGSILAVVVIIIMFLTLAYGAGESIIRTISSWFN